MNCKPEEISSKFKDYVFLMVHLYLGTAFGLIPAPAAENNTNLLTNVNYRNTAVFL